MFRQNFTCFALLKYPVSIYPYGTVTPYGQTFQTVPVFETG